jgi:hypothetical protein
MRKVKGDWKVIHYPSSTGRKPALLEEKENEEDVEEKEVEEDMEKKQKEQEKKPVRVIG